MRKFQTTNPKLQNLKLFKFLNLFIVICLGFGALNLVFSPTVTHAADSSPSAGLNDNLKSQFKTLEAEIASRAAQLKQQVSNQLQNKVYLGVVKSISDNSSSDKTIILATKDGSRIINTNDYTEYIDVSTQTKTSRKTLFKEAAADDYIAALGDVDNNDVMTAKKIVKEDNPGDAVNVIIWGQITSLNDQGFNLQTKDQKSLSFNWDSNTDFEQGNGTATSDNLKVGGSVITVGAPDKGNSYLAQLIYFTPAPTAASLSAKPKK